MTVQGDQKILVTGATGFVGRALCQDLAANGKRVVGVGRSESVEFESDVDFLRLDLKESSLRELALDGIDCVVHLAGQAHGKGGGGNQELAGFRRANVELTLQLARHAIESGVRRFVFVSSIGVHGMATDGEPITETSPLAPSSPYAVSKLEAETQLARLFEAHSGSELTIIRPPLVFGIEAPGNFHSLLRLARSPLPLPFGNCANRRSLVSIENLVSFIKVCIEHPRAANEAFVVCDRTVVSTKEIIACLREGMGMPQRLVSLSPKTMRRVLRLIGKTNVYTQLYGDLEVDYDKAQRLLDWFPEFSTSSRLKDIGRHYVHSHV